MSIHLVHPPSVLHPGAHRRVGAPRAWSVIGTIVLLLAAGTGAAVVNEIAVHSAVGLSTPIPSPQPGPPAVAPHGP